MRILFSALPSHGHCYPLIPLAVAAREAGHEIVFATGESFHPPLVAAGLDPVPAGASLPDAVGEAMRGRHANTPHELDEDQRRTLMSQVFGEVLARCFANDVRDLLHGSRFDLVVFESGNPGAGLAAMLAGVPSVGHGFGRGNFGALGSTYTGALGELGAEFGLSLPESVTPLGKPYLDIYPASLQEPEMAADAKRIPLRPVPFAEPGDLPALATADRGRPLVYLTLGTAFASSGVLRGVLDGLASLDVDVLVTTGPQIEVSELPGVPGNVTLVPWVPQADLLPHLDLAVHHGGSGTTLGALGAGVPQLIIPQGADQFTNAAATSTAGVSRQLLAHEVTPEAITDQATALLAGTGTADGVRRVASEIAAMPSPKEIVDRFAEFAS